MKERICVYICLHYFLEIQFCSEFRDFFSYHSELGSVLLQRYSIVWATRLNFENVVYTFTSSSIVSYLKEMVSRYLFCKLRNRLRNLKNVVLRTSINSFVRSAKGCETDKSRQYYIYF